MEDHVLLFKAIRALGIDVPVSKYEVLRPGVIKIYLAWGEPRIYDANQASQASQASPAVDNPVVETTKKRKGKNGN